MCTQLQSVTLRPKLLSCTSHRKWMACLNLTLFLKLRKGKSISWIILYIKEIRGVVCIKLHQVISSDDFQRQRSRSLVLWYSIYTWPCDHNNGCQCGYSSHSNVFQLKEISQDKNAQYVTTRRTKLSNSHYWEKCRECCMIMIYKDQVEFSQQVGSCQSTRHVTHNWTAFTAMYHPLQDCNLTYPPCSEPPA